MRVPCLARELVPLPQVISRMRQHFLLLASPLLLLAGCATTSPPEGPRLQRLSAEEAQRIGLTLPKPVTLDEIVAMSRAGTAPDAIIQRMRETASVYRLTPLDISRLQQARVPQAVIDEMTAQQRREEAQLARERAEREALAWRRSYWSPWGPDWGSPWGYGYSPRYGPRIGIGAFNTRGRFGYGTSIGVPLGGWWW